MIPLYQNIKNLREKLGMSQGELAKLVGYTSQTSIAKIESGNVDLSQSKIMAFARALKTTPTALMGLEDEKENGLNNDDPEELIILNRTAKKMTPEKQKKLLEIAKIMFAEDFKKNE